MAVRFTSIARGTFFLLKTRRIMINYTNVSWILIRGYWNDNGYWKDTSNWID